MACTGRKIVSHNGIESIKSGGCARYGIIWRSRRFITLHIAVMPPASPLIWHTNLVRVSKHPNFWLHELFRASHSHNSTSIRILAGLSPHYILIEVRVIKSFLHRHASMSWTQTFDTVTKFLPKFCKAGRHFRAVTEIIQRKSASGTGC